MNKIGKVSALFLSHDYCCTLVCKRMAATDVDEVEERLGHPVKKPPSLLKSFIAGGVGGICLVASGHPLDTIKVFFNYHRRVNS